MNCTHQANTAVGFEALELNTSGDTNTAIGALSLTANTTGGNSTAVGGHTLQSATTGTENTAVGRQAGANVTTGIRNTFVGKGAGENNITTGANNLILGFNATGSSSTVSNEVTFGNTQISSIRCNTTSISSLSDRRDKTEIIDLPLGIEFLNTLKPVKFKWATRDGNIKDGQYRAGFIAQDLQEAQKGNEYLDLILDENPDRLEARENNLFPVLVKAIQELSAKNTALETRVAALEAA